jgi:hypothetical protein
MKIAIIVKSHFIETKYVFDFIFSTPICISDCTIIYYDELPSNYDIYDCIFMESDGSKVIHENIIVFSPGVLIDRFKLMKPLRNLCFKNVCAGIYELRHEKFPKYECDLGLDFISTIFFCLTRWEEAMGQPEFYDKHGRMKDGKHLLIQTGIQDIPVVDNIVKHVLDSCGLFQQKVTSTIMTHDIDVLHKFDTLKKVIRGVARILAYPNKHSGSLYRFIVEYVRSWRGCDPFQTFDWLFEHNINGGRYIFFMSGGSTRYDGYYDVRSAQLKEILLNAKNQGYEVGLHPSYNTRLDEEMLAEELSILADITAGKTRFSRQHILRFDIIKTPKLLERVGIEMDFTLGYSSHIGFRCGTGFDFNLWDLENWLPLKINERPLIVMDGCLLKESSYDVKRAKNRLDDFLLKTSFNTQITFNFHNSVFDPVLINADKFKELYLELCDY